MRFGSLIYYIFVFLANLNVSSALSIVVATIAVATTTIVALSLLPEAPGQHEGGGGQQKQQCLHVCCSFESRAGCGDWLGQVWASSPVLSYLWCLPWLTPSPARLWLYLLFTWLFWQGDSDLSLREYYVLCSLALHLLILSVLILKQTIF